MRAYDPVGNLIQLTDYASRITRYEYDALNRLITTTNALGDTEVRAYDPVGNLIQLTDYASRITRYEYDALNRLITTTNALGDTEVRAYDPVGNLIRVTDYALRTTHYDYDALNRLVATTDPLSHTTRYAYDRVGNQTAVTDATGIATYSGYDGLARRVWTRDALGNTTRFGYDAVGNNTVVTDALGVVTRYEYDALNRLIAVIENYRPDQPPDYQTNVRTAYAYDAVGNRTVITDANGHVTRHVYDALNRIVQTIDPLSHIQTFVYDAVGNLVESTDPKSQTTRFEYDALNRLVRVVYPEQTVELAYDAVGNRIVMTDSVGITRYQYDDMYRLVQVTDPYTGTVRYRYDPVGNRTALIYPDGQVVTYTYDAANNLVQVADYASGFTFYDYDAAGRVLTTTLPNGMVTVHAYDEAGRLVGITHTTPGGERLSEFRYTLDGMGRRVMVTETLVLPTPPAADFSAAPLAGNAPLTVTFTDLSTGTITSRLWDFGDGLTGTLTNPVHVYTTAGVYTVSLTVTGPGGTDQEIRPGYITVLGEPATPPAADFSAAPLAGSVPLTVTFTDLSTGTITSRLWDFGDGLTSTLTNPVHVYTTAGVYTVSLTVNGPAGHDVLTRTAYIRAGATIEGLLATLDDYYAQGQITRQSVYNRLRATLVQAQSYIRQGQRLRAVVSLLTFIVQVSVERGRRITAAAADHLVGLAWQLIAQLLRGGSSAGVPPAGGGWAGGPAARSGLLLGDPLILFMAPLIVLAAFGRRRRGKYWAWPVSLVLLVVALAAIGWSLAAPAHAAMAAPSYEPSPAPAVRSAGETLTRTITYTYDPLGRLTEASYSTGESFAYAYDAAGNRTVYTETTPLAGTTVTTYTYDAADRLLVSLSPGHLVSYTWDANGNLLSDGQRTFTYDAANRLVQVISGTLTTEYAYSGDGVRLAQTVNGQTTRYVNDVAAPLPQVLVETRQPTNQPTNQLTNQPTTYLYGLELLAQQEAGAWAYHHPDGLGSVRQLTDEAGQVTLARSFAPFGELLSQVGKAAGSFGFAGEQADAAAGLIYLRARYYDPITGRFLTRDVWPALAPLPQSLHRYTYCSNDPVNRTDPSGRFPNWIERNARRLFGNRVVDTAKSVLGVPGKVVNVAVEVGRTLERGITAADNWARRESAEIRQDPFRYVEQHIVKPVEQYSVRKQAELTHISRQTVSAAERGDWGAAATGFGQFMLAASGLSDVTRTETGRAVLGGAMIVGATIATGGAALVPIAMSAALGGGIAYGAEVYRNVTQRGMSLRESRTWTQVDWGAIGEGAFHGAVAAAAAEVIMPALPSGGIGLRGIAETAVTEFVGGRAAQVAVNVARGEEWSANLLNPVDIALDVVPGVAAATWRTVKAARAAEVLVPGQLDDVGRAASASAGEPLDEAARQAAEAPRLLPAGEPASLAGQPERLLRASSIGRTLELGPGGGENLLRIAEARPNKQIVGMEISDDMVRLARLRIAHSPYPNIGIVQADYLKSPFQAGQFDEVIAIAPGSTKRCIENAARAATANVSAGGRLYIVTDLGEVPEAIGIIQQGLESRGLRGHIVPGFREVSDIAVGRNPLGIPLESDFFGGYYKVWEIFVQVER